ncbi:cytochrome-c peroxidase [Crocinitomix sp.]|nr:cytochrome-c peroxidase [Crocinitomix sp.]
MRKGFVFIGIVILAFGCRKDPLIQLGNAKPYQFDYPERISKYLSPIQVPTDNQMTVEGVELGRKIFYDERLSADNTMSCAGCHAPELAFSDPVDFSTGIDGVEGRRNAMNLINLGWMDSFFWDGRKATLEDQAFAPVNDPVELHSNWVDAVTKLQADSEYPAMFEVIYGTSKIDSTMVAQVLAQFERTLISGNSPMDKFMNANSAIGSSGWNMTDEFAAYQGFALFINEDKGDCFHCHGDSFNPLWTDNLFHNNGLDAIPTDLGLGEFTGNPDDFGKFKTPTLRNLAFTAPYMHDGRFETLDEVINHYSEGLQHSATIDPLMKTVDVGGVQLTEEEKYFLKMFLISLSDSTFISNPAFSDPG